MAQAFQKVVREKAARFRSRELPHNDVTSRSEYATSRRIVEAGQCCLLLAQVKYMSIDPVTETS